MNDNALLKEGVALEDERIAAYLLSGTSFFLSLPGM
jgi:hypothetical protein